MAGSVNKVILVGRVGKDPEIRSTQSGVKIANLSLATSESWVKDGERQEKTEWHKISCMNDRTTDFIEKFVKKGSLVYVEGALQTRKWSDQQGQDRYSTEVVIGRFNGQLTQLDSRSSEGGSQEHQSSDAAPRQQARSAAPAPTRARDKGKEYAGAGSDLNDEIPW